MQFERHPVGTLAFYFYKKDLESLCGLVEILDYDKWDHVKVQILNGGPFHSQVWFVFSDGIKLLNELS
jgi:hypothetical protein